MKRGLRFLTILFTFGLLSVTISTSLFAQGSTLQTITFLPISNKTIGDADFSLSATAQSGGTVTFTIVSGGSIASVTGSTVTLSDTAAGTVVIRADQAGDVNFAAAPSVLKSFTVSKKDNTISFPTISSKLITDDDFSISATSASGLSVTFSISSGGAIASISGSTITLSDTASGYVTVKAEQAGNDTVKTATPIYKTFLVSKQSNSVTFSTISNKTIGDANFSLTGTSSSGLPVIFSVISGGSIASVSGSIVTLSDTAYGYVTIRATQAGNDTVNTATPVYKSFLVSQQSNVISFASIPNKTMGDAAFGVTATASSGLSVTLSIIAGNSIASISGSTITLSDTASGYVTVKAVQAGNDSTASATPIYRSFLVSQQSNVINFSTIASKTMGDAAFGVTATASSGLTVTFSITSGGSIASISGSTITLSDTAYGYVTVKAEQGGNDTVASATPVYKSFLVSQQSNVISFSTIASKTIGDAAFGVTATSSSGLAVTFSITSGGSIASISGSTITLSDTAYGYVTVKAEQAGNDTIKAATPVYKSFSVSQQSNVITFSSISNKTMGDAAFSVSGTSSSGLAVTFSITSGGSIASISGSTITLSDTAYGYVTVKAEQAGNDSIKAATPVYKNFLVSQQSNVISFSTISNKTMGAAAFGISATSSSGLAVTFSITSGGSIASISGSTITLSDTAYGYVTVKAEQTGNDTVKTATPVYKSFLVSQQSNVITFSAISSKTMGDAAFGVSATASSGLSVTFSITSGGSIASISGSTITLSDTAYGYVTVKAEQAGNDTIKAATSVYKSFLVSQQPNVITFSTIPSKTMGDAAFGVSATSSSGLAVTFSITSGGSIASVSGSTITLSDTAYGYVTVKAEQAGNDTIKAATSVSKSFLVSQQSNTISFSSISNKTIGDADFTISATSSSGLPVTFSITSGGSIASISGSTISLSDTAYGYVTVRAVQAGNDTIKAATSVSKSFLVSQQSNTISFSSISSKTMGDAAFSVSATSSSGLPVTFSITSGGSIASISGSTVTLSDTAYGYVTIKAEQAGNDTVKAATASYKSFLVSQQSNSINFSSISNKTMGDAAFSVSATSSSGLPVTYSIASGGSVASISGSTVTLSDTAYGYVTIKAEQAGNDTVKAASPVYKSFLVSQQSNSITFSSISSKTMGDAAFNVSATASSGLAVTYSITSGGSIASISGNTVTLSDTAYGYVTIKAEQAGNDTVKAANAVSKTFLVSQQSNVISFSSIAGKKIFDDDFTISATASSGLAVTYSITAGGSIASISGSTVTLSDTAYGYVTVKAEQAGNDTVKIATPVYKTFLVSKATQTISWTTIGNKVTTDSPFTVTATASSGLTTTLSVYSGPATISGTTVTLTGVSGTVKLKATQTGNGLYSAASDQYITFSVNSAVLKLENPHSKEEVFTSTSNISPVSGVEVYPNPSHGLININSEDIIKSITVYDMIGNSVYSASYALVSGAKQLELSTLPKGLYFVNIATSTSELTRRVVID